jgi:hypothetical protein
MPGFGDKFKIVEHCVIFGWHALDINHLGLGLWNRLLEAKRIHKPPDQIRQASP